MEEREQEKGNQTHQTKATRKMSSSPWSSFELHRGLRGYNKKASRRLGLSSLGYQRWGIQQSPRVRTCKPSVSRAWSSWGWLATPTPPTPTSPTGTPCSTSSTFLPLRQNHLSLPFSFSPLCFPLAPFHALFCRKTSPKVQNPGREPGRGGAAGSKLRHVPNPQPQPCDSAPQRGRQPTAPALPEHKQSQSDQKPGCLLRLAPEMQLQSEMSARRATERVPVAWGPRATKDTGQREAGGGMRGRAGWLRDAPQLPA